MYGVQGWAVRSQLFAEHYRGLHAVFPETFVVLSLRTTKSAISELRVCPEVPGTVHILLVRLFVATLHEAKWGLSPSLLQFPDRLLNPAPTNSLQPGRKIPAAVATAAFIRAYS
jgi:hypothetical protein